MLHINVQRFRGGLVLKAHRLCVSLNSRLESYKEEGMRTPCSDEENLGSKVNGVGLGSRVKSKSREPGEGYTNLGSRFREQL